MNVKSVLIDTTATKLKISLAHELLLPIKSGANINPDDIWKAIEHLESAYKRLAILEEGIKNG